MWSGAAHEVGKDTANDVVVPRVWNGGVLVVAVLVTVEGASVRSCSRGTWLRLPGRGLQIPSLGDPPPSPATRGEWNGSESTQTDF